MCVLRGAKVPIHPQEQLTQTLIACQNSTCFHKSKHQEAPESPAPLFNLPGHQIVGEKVTPFRVRPDEFLQLFPAFLKHPSFPGESLRERTLESLQLGGINLLVHLNGNTILAAHTLVTHDPIKERITIHRRKPKKKIRSSATKIGYFLR